MQYLLVKQRKSTRKKKGAKDVLSAASLMQEEYNGESFKVYQGILLCHQWQQSQFFLIAVQVQQINAVTAGHCQTTCFETQPISCQLKSVFLYIHKDKIPIP